MKNINIYFGYLSDSTFSKITYWLCYYLRFIPTWEIKLFTTYHNSDKPFKIRHSITFGIFNFMVRVYKVNGKWKYEKY